MVEAAMSIPLFFIFIFFLVDVCRYFFTAIILNYAAYQAADFASKLEIEVPINQAACQAAPAKCVGAISTACAP